MPALAALALVPGADKLIGRSLAAVRLGPSADDKRRKEWAAALEARAVAGDVAAVRELEFAAFDVRGRSPLDTRTPRDGNYSPAVVRRLAVAALQRVVAGGGRLSSRERYAQLRVPLPTTATQDLVRAIVTPAAEQIAPDVGAAVAEGARPVIGRAVVVGVAAVGLLVLALVVLRRG